MDNNKLLDSATRGEWTLEDDKKVLEIMQNIASKIEKRAVNTKTNMNTMSLRLDESRVKMSNLTRISDVKNLVYCENLITDDHHLPSSSNTQVPKKNLVRQSKEVAIANGIKLVENCFDKHKLKQDPSSSRSEETIIYRPIDQYYSSLPYLIGSDKWKDKWHLGLMENDDRQSQAGSVYADSVDSSVVSKPNEQIGVQTANLSSSQDSLAKSINSVGDQMVINSKQGGLFDEPILSSEPSIYKPQPATRNIVNFFDDEPPELPSSNPSPLIKRKPTNLFDDVESVESMPIYEPEINQQQQTQLPPVDLFNDNEFDDFITKMEKNRNHMPKEETVSAPKLQNEEKVINVNPREVNVQRDMKNIADEISKKIQLRKSEQPGIKKNYKENISKTEAITVTTPKIIEKPKVESKQVIKPEPEEKVDLNVDPKPKKRIMNLFDDEDDSEDFFQDIIKQKSVNTPTTTCKSNEVIPAVKTVAGKKISNLFDDEEEDDNFDKIFKDKEKSSTPVVSATKNAKEPSNKKFSRALFDDDNSSQNIVKTSEIKESKVSSITKQPTPKKLFDDDDNDDFLFKSNKKTAPQVGQTNQNIKDAILAGKLENSSNIHAKEERSAESVIPDTSLGSNVNDLERSEQPNSEIIIENVVEEKKSQIADTSQIEAIISTENSSAKENDNEAFIEKDVIQEPTSRKSPSLLPCDSEKEEKNHFNESVISSSQNTMPLFSDEPPEDDTWDEDFNNFEEPETKQFNAQSTFSPNTSSYSVPLFDEFPPDDDDRNPPPIPEFDDELSDYDEKEESQLEVPKIHESPFKNFIQEELKHEEIIEDTLLSNTANSDFKGQNDENKLIITDTAEIIKHNDETEKSLPSVEKISIKSKLDMFSRPPETPPAKQSEPKKLPGKLNTSLNINVGALMPGAKIPVKKLFVEQEPLDVDEKLDDIKESQPTEPSKSSNLLNNDIAKSRAKISIKRRPSTRSGRRSNYEKSLSSQFADNEEINESEDLQNERPNPAPSSNNLSQSIFGEDDEENDFLSIVTSKKKDQVTSKKPQTVTTNKISVFYDDEEETKKMLEKQKLSKEIPKTEPPKKELLKLFDEANINDNLLTDVEPPRKFSNQNLEIKKENVQKQASLFDDDNDEDDLFGGVTKKLIEKPPKKNVQVESEKLFNDDEEDDLFGDSSKNISSRDKKPINQKIPPPKSLFGDESDDDDLFSTKPKSTSSKKSSSKSAEISSKTMQKTVDDDPLKDLMGN